MKLKQRLRFIISLMRSWRLLLITRNTLNRVLLASVCVLEQVTLCYAENVFSTIMDETLLCLTSLFNESRIPALLKCLVDSVLLPEALQASYSADSLYHVISRIARLHVKKDTDGLPESITLQSQACLFGPSCLSALTVSHEDLVLNPDMNFCETWTEPLVAYVKLTPALGNL